MHDISNAINAPLQHLFVIHRSIFFVYESFNDSALGYEMEEKNEFLLLVRRQFPHDALKVCCSCGLAFVASESLESLAYNPRLTKLTRTLHYFRC